MALGYVREAAFPGGLFFMTGGGMRGLGLVGAETGGFSALGDWFIDNCKKIGLKFL